jgi:hypothetical protein
MMYKFSDKDLHKQYVSVSLGIISPILFHQTDVDRMIVHIGERLIKKGIIAPPQKKKFIKNEVDPIIEYAIDIQALNEFRINSLIGSPRISGFDSPAGRELISAWLRTSVVNEVTSGKGHQGGPRIVDYLEPLSVATYRSGLPFTRSKHRNADTLIYGAMRHFIATCGSISPENDLAQLAEDVLGNGISFGIYPHNNPEYDGKTVVDIETLLEISFIETFMANDSQAKAPHFDWDFLVPGAIEPLGQDLTVFLKHIRDEASNGKQWSTRDVINVISSLVSFRLLQMPIRLGRGLRAVISESEIQPDVAPLNSAPANLSWPNPCQMYFDFTEEPESESDLLAKRAVTRDMNILHSFQDDRMFVKALELLLPMGDRQWRNPIQEDLKTRKYRQAIWKMLEAHKAGDYELPARQAFSGIENQYVVTEDDSEIDYINRDYVEDVKAKSESDFEAFYKVLQNANESLGLGGLHKWYRTVTGLSASGDRKPYCALRGTPSAKQTWRYSFSDQLLISLVYLCFAEYPQNASTVFPNWSNRISLATLLNRLELRFGVLIQTIPEGMDSPGAREAVTQNLEAFKHRLKMLGCFEDLSDDLVAQYVRRPM